MTGYQGMCPKCFELANECFCEEMASAEENNFHVSAVLVSGGANRGA